MNQEQFAAAILNPELPVPEGLLQPDGSPATRRFNVYRNNVIVSLAEAIAEGFPVVNKLVGDEFFRFMARQYVAANPPDSPLLFCYGQSFPKFVAGFTAAESVPYLADIARLEWARRESYHAADALARDASCLAEFGADAFPLLVFDLIPSTRIVESRFPVQSIWEVNVGTGNTEMPDSGEDVLVARPEMEIEMRRLPPGGARFINALLDGTELGRAAGLAASVEGFELSSNITIMLEARLIHNVQLAGET